MGKSERSQDFESWLSVQKGKGLTKARFDITLHIQDDSYQYKHTTKSTEIGSLNKQNMK